MNNHISEAPIPLEHLTTILRIEGESALFAFQSGPILHSKITPRINRFYQQEQCYSPKDCGSVIGYGVAPHCALMIKACEGDVVAIAQRTLGGSSTLWSFFRVGKDFEVLALKTKNRKLSYKEINGILKIDSRYSKPLIVESEDIEFLYSEKQPDWLESILESQLEHWHRNAPYNYYKYTRCQLSGKEIQRCVDHAPYVALTKWKSKLTEAQLQQAIRSSPSGAVRYAIDAIPVSLRAEYLRKNPSDALMSAHKLTDDELTICATEDFRTAFKIRSQLPPRRKAILLANTYTNSWDKQKNCHLDHFREEVLESIKEFPWEWMTTHSSNFECFVNGLRIHLSLELEPRIILLLLNNVSASDRKEIGKYISAHI